MKTILFLLVVSTVMVNAPGVFATDQVWDSIVVDGDKHVVLEHTLANFWTRETRPRFDAISTANWKGYTTSWEIRDSTLLLTSFDANIDGKPVNPKSLFEGKDLPIHAGWFTGKITVIQGPPLQIPGYDFMQASATVYLIRNGDVSHVRRIEDLQFRRVPGFVGFTVRDDGQNVVLMNVDNHISKEISDGDILHAILDKNGFSMIVDSIDVAKAVLSGYEGTELSLILAPRKEPTMFRVVKIKRVNPLRSRR